jgi:hypothetical protein
MPIDPNIMVETTGQGDLCFNQITTIGLLEEFGSAYRYFMTTANGTVFLYYNKDTDNVIASRDVLKQKLSDYLSVKHPYFKMDLCELVIPLIAIVFPVIEHGKYYKFGVQMGTTSIFFNSTYKTEEEAIKARELLLEWIHENSTDTPNPVIQQDDENYYS